MSILVKRNTIRSQSFSLTAMDIKLLTVGLILLPFSTSVQSGVVFSFGLPFILLFTVFITIFGSFANVGKSFIFFISFSYAFLTLLLSFFSSDIFAAFYRSSVFFIGYLIYLFFSSKRYFLGHDQLVNLHSFLERILTISGVILSIYYLYNFFMVSIRFGLGVALLDRVSGGLTSLPWAASNVVAATLSIPFFASLSLIAKKQNNLIYIFAPLIILLAILTTLSRTTMLVLVFSGILLMFFGYFSTIKYLFSTAILITIALLFNMDLLNVLFINRIQDNSNFGLFSGRLDIWIHTLSWFINNPFSILGYFGSIYKFGNTPHNFILQNLIEMGFLGLIFIFSIIISNLSHLAVSRRSFTSSMNIKIYFTGLISIFCILFFEDAIFTHQFAIYFWIFLALVYLVRYIDFRNDEIKAA